MQRVLRQASSLARGLAQAEIASTSSACTSDGCSQWLGGRLSAWDRTSTYTQARGATSRRTVEVILLEDVRGLGFAGHIVRVKPGRARNQLIPSETAKYNTFENRHRYAELIEAAKGLELKHSVDEKDVEFDRISKAISTLRGGNVSFRLPANASANDTTRVFDKDVITASRVQHEVLRQLRVDMPAELIDVQRPINTFGEHRVPLRFTLLTEDGLSVRPHLTVTVRKKRTKKLAKNAET